MLECLQSVTLPDDPNIYLNLLSPESEYLSRISLQQKLLKHSYSLVEHEQFADIIIDIQEKEAWAGDPDSKSELDDHLYLVTDFTLRIARYSDSKVLLIESKRTPIQRHEQPQKAKTEDKWYTPFLIVLAIGSLIYLLFYGSN